MGLVRRTEADAMSIIDLVPGARWIELAAIAAAIAAAVGAYGLQHHKITTLTATLAAERAERATERANAATQALAESTAYRALETKMQAQTEKAAHVYQSAITRNAHLLNAARADSERLRDQLAAYAANSGGTAPDTVATASERAATLGQLLADALRSDAARTADAEANADAVRALLAAWPK